MNYQQARIFCIFATIIIVLLFAGALFKCSRSDDAPATELPDKSGVSDKPDNKPKEVALSVSPAVGNLAAQFNDLNDEHLKYAEKTGIRPIYSAKDILGISKPIVEVKSGANYYIDDLTHSYPYLVPQAAELLDTIGARFNRKLAAQNGGKYRIKVTSLLRTAESVNRLGKSNVNSTGNSAHLYATTFDISYVKFYEEPGNDIKHNDGNLKNLLAEVLLELKNSGKCKVKYERKQGCFHITATGL